MWHCGSKSIFKTFLMWFAVAQFSNNIGDISAIEYSELKCDFDLSTGNQICDCQHRNKVNIIYNKTRLILLRRTRAYLYENRQQMMSNNFCF